MPSIPDTFAATGLHVQAGPTPVTRFQVVGERSSGTNYVKRLLGRNTGLKPTEALGWKHGGPQALAIPADLLVVICVRHAGDWARSMHAKPWHAAPALQAMDFPAFLRAPWDSVIDRPRYFDVPGVQDMVGLPLQADRDPATGLPYPDLPALRQGKLVQHLGYLGRHDTVALIRMEEATQAPDRILDTLLAALSLPARTGALRPVVKRLGSKFKPALADRPATPACVGPADMEYLRSRIDVPTETALGYRY
ncbi:hypothetical protein LA6_001564 [Marinibacterium anthonyi]|nr:hypothetical protein LA6_001564 [Marinibacterium anthonyi]